MSESVVEVRHDEELYGMIVRSTHTSEETEFFTPGELPLQFGVFSRDDGYEEPLHRHRKAHREIEETHQVLVLTEGVLTVTFATEAGEAIAKHTVEAGDALLLASGAHSVSVEESVSAITIKQGPYLGENQDQILLNDDPSM